MFAPVTVSASPFCPLGAAHARTDSFSTRDKPTLNCGGGVLFFCFFVPESDVKVETL